MSASTDTGGRRQLQLGKEYTVGVGWGMDLSFVVVMKLLYLLNHVTLAQDGDV